MPTAADFIAAYRRSHNLLVAASEGLTEEQLSSQSFDTEWSVAQVLSHLGSGAEIFGHILDAGLAGADAPGMDVYQGIWARWDAKGPVEMRDDALASDTTLTEKLEALTPEQAEAFGITLWAGPMDLAGVVRMRLSEHALHTWDVEASFSTEPTVPADTAGLLLPGVGAMAGRAGKPQDPAYRVVLESTDGHGAWTVSTADPVTMSEGAEDGADGVVRLPSEAILRLLSGRLRPDYTPALVESGERGVADLRVAFPGF
jgi:uncharacterized protein (TIGR03083 family)